MEYTIQAIETDYRKYKFRSRLEATWAVFFDLVGWQWEYEPTDFKGWIPDFAIYGRDVVYVEVKPTIKPLVEVFDKIDRSQCEQECLLLGMSCPIPEPNYLYNDESRTLGWLRSFCPDHVTGDDGEIEELETGSWWWEDASIGRWTAGKGKIGFCHSMGMFSDRISGGYDGGCYGEGHIADSEIRSLWAMAKNGTKWYRG